MTSSLDEAREYHRLAEANISHQGGAVSGAHLSAQEQDSNLQFVRNQMLGREEADSATLLTLYRDMRAGKSVPHDETNPAVNVLQLSGVAHAVDGHMQVRNRIYEHVFDTTWVSENMPDAELRRQRAAYRRGMLRTGGIAAAVLVVVAALAAYGFVQSQKAEGATANALEITARAQIEQGVQMLEDGKDVGLLYLAEARQNAPEGSPLGRSAERIWAGWHEPYEDRLAIVIDVVDPVAVEFSPDGEVLAVATIAGDVHLFDAESGTRKYAPLSVRTEATALSFSPDGRFLGVGDRDGRIHMWRTAGWETLGTPAGHEDRVRALRFSRDGGRLASVSTRGAVSVWDTATWLVVSEPVPMSFEPKSLAISPDGTLVAMASSRDVSVWDADTGAPVSEKMYLVGYGEMHASTVAFSPDGSRLLTCARGLPVEAWDTDTWELLGPAVDLPVLAFSLSPDGRYIGVTEDKDILSVRDVAGVGTVGRPYWNPELGVAAFDPSRPRFAVHSTAEDRVLVWRIDSGGPRHTGLTSARTQVYGASAAYSPDGSVAAVGDNGYVHLFDTTTWRPSQPPLKHHVEVWAMEFGPLGETLATASTGAGLLHLWNVAKGAETRPPWTFPWQTPALAYHADGSLIAASGNDIVHVFDVGTGERLGRPLGGPHVWGIAFSPTEHLLAVCGAGGVELWNVDTWEREAYLPEDAGDSAYIAAFASDGSYLVVGGSTPHVT
ncbi:MAG: WD40 repeat domain-containing protein, partial [Candidatus Poribacteria bacterium]